jgi:hypothetical protein
MERPPPVKEKPYGGNLTTIGGANEISLLE